MARFNYSQSCVIQEDTEFPFNLTDLYNVTLKAEVKRKVEIVSVPTVIVIISILFVDVLFSFEVRF